MLCCKNTSIIPAELPFKRFISLDYYDGPTEGFALCTVCNNTFYFKLVNYDADENIEFCRIFVFSQIEIDFEYYYDYCRKIYQMDHVSLKNTLKKLNGWNALNEYMTGEITNICISDDYFHYGLWRKWNQQLCNINETVISNLKSEANNWKV